MEYRKDGSRKGDRSMRGKIPPPPRPGRLREWALLRRWPGRSLGLVLLLSSGIALNFGRTQEPRAEFQPAVISELEQLAPTLPALATGAPPPFEPVDPAQAGLDLSTLESAEDAVRREVRRGAFPGAALIIGRGERIAKITGIGHTSWNGKAVDPSRTVYDLASLTKVVATTTAIMLLVEDGKLELDSPVSAYLPSFTGGAKNRVTVRHLLTHTSGLPAGTGSSGSSEALLQRIIATPLKSAPGARVVYSDLGPIVLWEAAERAAGESLEDLLDRRVFGPLGMHTTRFRPSIPCQECAPTTPQIRGRVHDPLAHRLGGVTGNAGLFSTAEDLGRFAAMLANGGEFNSVRIVQEATLREFTRKQPGAGTRALGWDTPGRPGNGAAGGRIAPTAFGHTGFTGTSLWVDPERGTWTVLLTNRTYAPRAGNRIQALRRSIHDQVAIAVDQLRTD